MVLIRYVEVIGFSIEGRDRIKTGIMNMADE
jgi:hypothetical protein